MVIMGRIWFRTEERTGIYSSHLTERMIHFDSMFSDMHCFVAAERRVLRVSAYAINDCHC